ncbi:MAG: transposase [Thermoplasmata archaeon]|nr:transposase [Thermoplasmata archaeon]
MRPSKRDISRDKIENAIYKTFEEFKEEKSISAADFLNKLDLENLIAFKYRSIKFSYHSLLKLLIFQKLKGIKFQTQLERYLKRHPSEKFKLGFKQTPNQRTISYFLNHILDKQTKETIDFIANKIREISEKFGIIFDIDILKPEKPKKKLADRTIYYKKAEKTREICRFFKRRVSSFLNLNLHHNTVYSKNTFLDLLIHMCMTNDFAENGSKTFIEQRKAGPNGDTLLYHLKNYQNIDQLQRMFKTIFEVIFETARKSNMFKKPVDVAIDFTEWFFYGDKNATMVAEKKPERGTTHCYKFATINIVEGDKRFTLLALPVGPFDRKEYILEELLRYASRRVKIRRLYVDRGFFDSKSIEIFNQHRIKFLMPCTENPRIKNLLQVMPPPKIIKDYKMGATSFNIAIVEDEQRIKRAFATNIDFNENDANLSKWLFELYAKRWGIETSYRVKKHSFRPKTTSKNYLIRLFYFLFSALLYNLWILVDILICLAIFGFKTSRHVLTSKYFGTILLTIDPGG